MNKPVKKLGLSNGTCEVGNRGICEPLAGLEYLSSIYAENEIMLDQQILESMVYAPEMPNRLAKSTELVRRQQQFPLSRKHVAYVDCGVVAAGTGGRVAGGVEIVIVLVPAYIVLVRRTVVVLVVSTSVDLLTSYATSIK